MTKQTFVHLLVNFQGDLGQNTGPLLKEPLSLFEMSFYPDWVWRFSRIGLAVFRIPP